MTSAMAKRLEGKTILITGASSGIGCSTAFEFARTGAKKLKLILTARRIDTLKQIATDIMAISDKSVEVLTKQLDVSNPAEVHGFLDTIPPEWQDIDVLVNNAYVMF